MKIFSSQQIRLAEKLAVETAGISSLKLMENAGNAAADIIKSEIDVRGLRCVAVCGKGGNGGDGFVAAMRLLEAGALVSVVLSHGKPQHSDAAEMYEKMSSVGIICVNWQSDPTGAASVIADADILIDGIFGIGFKGCPDETASNIIECMNHSNSPIYSLDIPSGADADKGTVDGVCVNAVATIAFSCPKFAHIELSSAFYCGQVHIVDIGIPQKLISQIESDFDLTDSALVRSYLPARSPAAHKGDCGRVLIICGSYTMPGAALMCCLGALRSGAGLVRLAVPESAYPFIAGKIMEPTYLPLPCIGNKTDGEKAVKLLIPEIEKADSIVIGCGMTDDDSLFPVIGAVLENAKCPVIIDADGINLLSRNINLLKNSSVSSVLTPHLGEMSRLVSESVCEIKRNRVEYAKKAAREFNCCVVLKGPRTLISSPDGKVYCNLNGNAGMAVGGSGDVLAGIIGGLAAQGMQPEKAAACAVYIHGRSGDLCEQNLTQYSMTPTDILDYLPKVFGEIVKD